MPHPKEAKFIQKMFELRASQKYTDREIAEKLNKLGYTTRVKMVRSKTDPSKVVKQTGGNPLNERHLWRIIRNPIYAGINMEKWTDNKPVKCMFDGLVSIELFNRANKGKRTISVGVNDKIAIYDKAPPEHLSNKGKRNPDFPYKKYVMCPQCSKPLLGSASRGKSGKYYPAYHCNKRGHNFRVSKAEFDTTIQEFVAGMKFKPSKVNDVFTAIEVAWERSNAEYEADVTALDVRISELEGEAMITVEKIKKVSSDTAIKYMEEDLVKIEQQIQALRADKDKLKQRKPIDIKSVLARTKYFVEHLDELLQKQIDPVRKAQFFGLIFDQPPTYEDLKGRTRKTPHLTGVNPLFQALMANNSHLVNQPRCRTLWLASRSYLPICDECGRTAGKRIYRTAKITCKHHNNHIEK